MAIDEECSAGWEVGFCDEAGDGGFAAAGVADEGDGLAGGGGEGNVVKDDAGGGVAEADVLELDLALEVADGLGGGGIGPIWLGIQEAEDALCADEGGEGLGVLCGEVADGIEEEIGLEVELDDCADGGLMMEDAPAAEEDEEADEELAIELEDGEEDGAGAAGGDAVAGVIDEEDAEEGGIGLLADEALCDADAGDGFGESGGDAGEALLCLALCGEDLAAEVAIEEPDAGAEEGEYAEDDVIRPEHEDGGYECLTGTDDGDEDDVLYAEADGLEVRGHAADDAADFHVVKEGGGEGLEVGEDGIADVADDELAELEGVEDAEAEGDLCDEGYDGEDDGADGDAAEVASGDGALDDGAEEVGYEGELDAAEGGEDAEEDDDATMGTGEGEDAAHEPEELEGAEFDVAVFVAGDVG